MRTVTYLSLFTVTLAISANASASQLNPLHTINKPTMSAIPSTPEPLRKGNHARPIFLSRHTRIGVDDIMFEPQLRSNEDVIGAPVLVRFMLRNVTSKEITLFALPTLIAQISISNALNVILRPDRRVSTPHGVLKIAVIRLRPGMTVITRWYPLTDWGYKPTAVGLYTMSAHPGFLNATALMPAAAYSVVNRSTRVVHFRIVARL